MSKKEEWEIDMDRIRELQRNNKDLQDENERLRKVIENMKEVK